MISRYSTPEMTALFQPDRRFHFMLEVEIAVAEVQASMGLIPKSAARNIRTKANVDLKKIDRIEKETKHDVIAFVSQVAKTVGADGRFIHYGLTSSDVLDTAMSLQVRSAFQVLYQELEILSNCLESLALKHKNTICAGRTHGILAEPTTFGFKMAGHLSELSRVVNRLKQADQQFQRVKLSGAVGTSSTLGYEFEEQVGKKLGLTSEPFATQVVPRDRHAEVFVALGFLGAFFERLATELRHLQRSEVNEVVEGFQKGQKGSSAMPHKKNPISAENLTGLSRLLRSYMSVAFENSCLWHERDISHSSNERVMFPDAFIVSHYMTRRMCSLLNGLSIQTDQMQKNLKLAGGAIFSSHVLLYIIDQTGWSREKAYSVVQRAAHSLKDGETLEQKLLEDLEVASFLKAKELRKIFSGDVHKAQIAKRFDVMMKRLKQEIKK